MDNYASAPARVLDKKGNKHEVIFSIDEVTQIVGIDEVTGIPYLSVSLLKDGEVVSLWVDNDFRDTHGLIEGFLVYLGELLAKKRIRLFKDKYFYFTIHPSNKSAHNLLARMGALCCGGVENRGVKYNYYMIDIEPILKTANKLDKELVSTKRV
jgi:hypothetical protein